MFTAANDNAPPRAKMIPLLGELNIDTGKLRPAAIPRLIRFPPGTIFGPIRWPAEVVPFPSDPREA